MPEAIATVVSGITFSLYTVSSLHGDSFAVSAEHESGLMNDPRVWAKQPLFFDHPANFHVSGIPEAWK
jgi:hypothetical protein